MHSAEGALIEARGLSVALDGRAIVSDIDVTVGSGEIVTLIGPNGAGKSTIVRAMLGLQRFDDGTVERRPGLTVGYMPQRLAIDQTMPLTVGRFLLLGIEHKPNRTRGRRQAVLEEVGAIGLMDTRLDGVSGGEFQRVLLARALLRDPDLLVLDEPTQGVDITGQAELYRLITRIRDDRGCGVLLVSHDLHLVMAATDHVICVNRHVCCAGNPGAVANDPSYTELFGTQVAGALAVYHHDHDHTHDADGRVVPMPDDRHRRG